MAYEEAIRDLVKALGDKPDWNWAKDALDRYRMGDLLVHGTWSNGVHVLGAPLVLLDTYLSVPRHWRWMYHLAGAIACHIVNGTPLLPNPKVRL